MKAKLTTLTAQLHAISQQWEIKLPDFKPRILNWSPDKKRLSCQKKTKKTKTKQCNVELKNMEWDWICAV